MKEASRFLRRLRNVELFSVIVSRINWVVVGLMGVCRFIQIFIVVIIMVLNGGEVRVMSARSRFSAASVLVFAFFVEPPSARIVNTFESLFAHAIRSSLTLPEMKTRLLDDESFGNSVEVACVTD